MIPNTKCILGAACQWADIRQKSTLVSTVISRLDTLWYYSWEHKCQACCRSSNKTKITTGFSLGGSCLHCLIKYSCSETPDQSGPAYCMPLTLLRKFLHLVARSISHYSSFTLGCLWAGLPASSPLHHRPILSVHFHYATQRNSLVLNNTSTLNLTPTYFSPSWGLESGILRIVNESQVMLMWDMR